MEPSTDSTASGILLVSTVKYGSSSFSRTYSETTLEGTLESDWSRHKLTVTGEGSYQANISGEGQEEPTASVDAVLDLDLTETLGGQLAAGLGLAGGEHYRMALRWARRVERASNLEVLSLMAKRLDL